MINAIYLLISNVITVRLKLKVAYVWTKSDPFWTLISLFKFSLLFCSYTFSASKSMACWINLSPLCVALTRQSLGFMADWICVIKDDKQNHLLVTPICHCLAFAISCTSLKSNSKLWREWTWRSKKQRIGVKRGRVQGEGEVHAVFHCVRRV